LVVMIWLISGCSGGPIEPQPSTLDELVGTSTSRPAELMGTIRMHQLPGSDLEACALVVEGREPIWLVPGCSEDRVRAYLDQGVRVRGTYWDGPPEIARAGIWPQAPHITDFTIEVAP